MKIGLVDVDMLANPRKYEPKVELMKLGVYYQKNGHQVETLHERSDPFDYDMLCIFSDCNNVPQHFLRHPNINFYGIYFTNKIHVPFNNDEIDYEKANYKIYDNMLRFDFLSKTITEKRLLKIKNTEWVRLYPSQKPIDIYEIMTGEIIQLADNYFFDKDGWREVIKKIAIYAHKIGFTRPLLIRNQQDFEDFKYVNQYGFVNCKGLILTNSFQEFEELIVNNQQYIKDNYSKFVYNMGYDKNNLYGEMFYLEELETCFNKVKLLYRLDIAISNCIDMICYSTKPFTLTIYNTLYMWLVGLTPCTLSFYTYYCHRYSKQPYYIKFLNNLINKYPKINELFSKKINEEE